MESNATLGIPRDGALLLLQLSDSSFYRAPHTERGMAIWN